MTVPHFTIYTFDFPGTRCRHKYVRPTDRFYEPPGTLTNHHQTTDYHTCLLAPGRAGLVKLLVLDVPDPVRGSDGGGVGGEWVVFSVDWDILVTNSSTRENHRRPYQNSPILANQLHQQKRPPTKKTRTQQLLGTRRRRRLRSASAQPHQPRADQLLASV
ncbi:hypothetical protein IF2G_06789 [Cordyceps javanica]|nr:hypothetical protein IF2G_06789 [Cordyceps javanica]